MPLEVYIFFMDASDTTIQFFNDENNQVFNFTFDKEPLFFFFDKLNKMVLKEASLTVGEIENPAPLAQKFKLYQNQPNPFNTETKITYSISVTTNIKISILDINGREVECLVNEMKNPGKYKIDFNRANLPAGIYYYSIEADGISEVKKMLIN